MRRSALLQNKEYTEAHQVEMQYLDAHPDDADFHHRAAWTLTALRSPDEALEHQRRATELQPSNITYLRALAKLYAARGNEAEAEAASAQAVAIEESERSSERERSVADVRRLLDWALGAWRHAEPEASPAPLRFEQVLRDHRHDLAAGWLEKIPAEIGSVVDLSGIGRFCVGDPKQVLHKRLSRGIPWELPVAVLLMELASRCNPEALIVEVGANIGAHTIPMGHVATAPVFAFEPEITNYRDLQRNIALNKLNSVRALRMACSNRRGKGTMTRVLSDNPGMAQLTHDDLGDIEVISLDEWMAGRELGLLKMDAEEHEAIVLAGAEDTIRRSKPLILCEVLAEQAERLHGFFSRMGYEGQRVFRSDWLFVSK